MINRHLQTHIEKKMFKGKAIIIYGARQVGKSTLSEILLKSKSCKSIIFNADDYDVRRLFSEVNISKLKALINNSNCILIDEAQRIPEIGIAIKIIVDRIPGVQIIATGSSSFHLFQSVRESLTGRAWEFMLYPLSYAEITEHTNLLETERNLHRQLIYGSYPEVYNSRGDEQDLLKLLHTSYLYRDLQLISSLDRPEILDMLLRALALQVGNEVSLNELAQLISVDRATISKYIKLLENAFIIFSLPALAKNVRNEIKKAKKIYFWDNGIRNAVINNFNPTDLRTDIGALWENYCISERMKKLSNEKSLVGKYFWRTTQQQEIDYIEDINGQLNAFEFKWNPKKKARLPLTFARAYPKHKFSVINPENLHTFLL
ncbi:MAG: ATP-binding protein [Candidatus Marinimicrobia bacterium]|nr:ATP-binding protein [Candidatus Neomarinimicrobiota bacterium]